MGVPGGKSNEWVLVDGWGAFVAAVQLHPDYCNNAAYITTRTSEESRAIKFCTRGAARMLAALLNSHERRTHKKWKVIKL